MPLTPETLTRHELNGLHVEVVDAANPDLVGIAGRVVVETMRTLHLDCVATTSRSDAAATVGANASARVKQVPKQGTTFEFRLPRGDARFDLEPELGCDAEFDGSTAHRTRGGQRTDEAAGVEKTSGTASKRGSETAGRSAGQSGPDTDSVSRRRDDCEGVAYVTVDGARLLSRPALRTENAGDTTWR